MNVLDVVVNGDIGEKTVREYFKAYLKELLKQGEMFSGKRPLGNSGWERCLSQAVKDAGLASNHYEAMADLISAVDEL